MSGTCREALMDAWEWSESPHGWSGSPPVCPGVVGTPSQMSGSGREALPDVREWSGGPPRCPGEVGRLSRMSWKGRGPSRMSGSGREALPYFQERSGGPPE